MFRRKFPSVTGTLEKIALNFFRLLYSRGHLEFCFPATLCKTHPFFCRLTYLRVCTPPFPWLMLYLAQDSYKSEEVVV